MSERHIVIVGGGFSGTALAIQLARHGTHGMRVTVIEPRESLGQGVAYGTRDPAHRINVPASRMQLSADEEGDFDRWYRTTAAFKADPAARGHDGSVWPQRGQFAVWLAQKFAEACSGSPVILCHLRDRATALHNGVIHTAAGQRIRADAIVLAISHPPPAVPPRLHALQHHAGVIVNPWQPNVLSGIAADSRVAIIGSGLTMSDVVASLYRQGHRGAVLAFSRRGQLPRENLSGEHDSWALNYQRPQAATARAWLKRIRHEVRTAASKNLPWQRVLDDVRQNAQRIWLSWPKEEKRRFLRHLRPWWDVHRYRIAPQVSAVLDHLQLSGQLQVRAARLKQATADARQIVLTLSHPQGEENVHRVDWLIVTTGPAHAGLIDSDALLSQLGEAGVIRHDGLGLGIDVNAASQTLNVRGEANPHLFVVGPAARGRFGELMGLPQVAEHAEQVARQLLESDFAAPRRRCPASLTD